MSGSIDDTQGNLSRNFDLVKSINENDNRSLEILMQKEVALANLSRCIQKYLQIIFPSKR